MIKTFANVKIGEEFELESDRKGVSHIKIKPGRQANLQVTALDYMHWVNAVRYYSKESEGIIFSWIADDTKVRERVCNDCKYVGMQYSSGFAKVRCGFEGKMTELQMTRTQDFSWIFPISIPPWCGGWEEMEE